MILSLTNPFDPPDSKTAIETQMHTRQNPNVLNPKCAALFDTNKALPALIPKPIMLVHGAPPRMPLPPGIDARPMETTQTLEAGHGHASLELLEANRTLGRVDTVLLGRRVRKHARPAGRHGRQRVRAATFVRRRTWPAIPTVSRDAAVDVRLAQRLKVGECPGRQLAVADGALVLFGDLGSRDKDRVRPPARHCGRG